MTSAPPPTAVRSCVMVNTLFAALPGMRRVIGLTRFTLAMENLSPTFTVSPAVKFTVSDVPLWFAPLTVTVPAHVPAVCDWSDCDS